LAINIPSPELGELAGFNHLWPHAVRHHPSSAKGVASVLLNNTYLFSTYPLINMRPDLRHSLEDINLSTVPVSELLRAAENCPVISWKGTKIIRLTSTAVLKIGVEVSLQEVLNMRHIHYHSNGRIHIPRVYRYFLSGGLGHIVMEFVDGESLDAVPWLKRTTQQRQCIISQVNDALDCMRSIKSDTPGPVGCGVPMGGLFTVYGAGRAFQSATDMEPWFNQKLKILGRGDVTGRFSDLIMCHMDIKLRNLILDKEGRLWILDWAWAGFFPPAFEHTSLEHIPAEDPNWEFAQDLLHELQPVWYDETLVKLLLDVYQVNDGPFGGSHIISGTY
jgi:serine/threonine protein kinase